MPGHHLFRLEKQSSLSSLSLIKKKTVFSLEGQELQNSRYTMSRTLIIIFLQGLIMSDSSDYVSVLKQNSTAMFSRRHRDHPKRSFYCVFHRRQFPQESTYSTQWNAPIQSVGCEPQGDKPNLKNPLCLTGIFCPNRRASFRPELVATNCHMV